MELNLIYQVAWSFNKTTGIDVEMLISEAGLAYTEAMSRFDPSKGVKSTTFIYRCMQNHLTNYCKQEMKHKSTSLKDAAMSVENYEDKIQTFQDEVKSWPAECQELVRIILENFEELESIAPKMARGALTRELRNRGWQWKSIWTTMQNMPAILAKTDFSV